MNQQLLGNNPQPKYINPTQKERSNLVKTIAVAASFVLLVGAVGTLGFLYIDTKDENKELKEQVNASPDQNERAQQIVDKLKTLITIKDDERVNIQELTSENIQAFKEQDPNFYADAQVGQFLVVLPETQRVILFDETSKKIVNFSSYTIQVEVIPEEQIDAAEKPLNIEIWYSSEVTQDIVGQLVTALGELSTNYVIVSQKPTALQSYDGISLILLNQEAKPKMSQNLVAQVGTNKLGTVTPEGEAAAAEGTDAVIILGKVEQTTPVPTEEQVNTDLGE